ncbi:MAG: thioredoxin-dependent thiol peroxidase [Candidatus Onthovivens sp.]|nr:thioredoxin-dependent thiol peroxidase [Mollicutes bacterium]MDY4937050.1 thioredoxin-dependent thiol peroxidase [Candidatus Onthovivens sp.]
MLQIGTKAPSFELYDQNGTLHKLEDYKGRKVILYFYPKDNTPGCTKEACGYNENLSSFNDKNVVILGISKDSVSSHKKFESNFGLGFTLLSDENLDAIKKYDVWKEKKNYGKTYMGILRTTYLINEEGIIVFANDKVKAASDALTMLEKI